MNSFIGSLLLLLCFGGTGSFADDEGFSSPCEDCSASGTVMDSEIPKEEIRRIRMELIKEQILQKLRLEEPPRVTRPILPEILVSGHLLATSHLETENYEDQFTRDDFYGTTQEVVIFPDNTTTYNCYSRDEMKPNSCFRFRLTRDVTTRSVTAAELWVYKVVSVEDNEINSVLNSDPSANVAYTITDVAPHPNHNSFSKRVVAIEETTRSPGWLKFELAPAVRTWALRKQMAHALEISCLGCDTSLESPVSVQIGQIPFIVVHTDSWQVSKRQRRSNTCDDYTKHCCKEHFRVNFSDISWDKWIIHPTSYNADFCRGSCLSDVSASRYHYTTVLRRYIHRHPAIVKNLSLALCCTPSKMKPLTLIYIDEHNNIFKTALPNMIVDSCDCA